MSEIILRPATVDDAAEMLAIYAPYVIQTTVSSEYDAPTLEEFTRRIRTFTEKLPWLVCIIDGEVAGYGYASPHRTRAAYQWSVETSIYVAQDWHRHGIAGAIYAALFEVLAMQGYYNIYVGITSPTERSSTSRWALSFRAPIRRACTSSASGATCSGWVGACVRTTAHPSRPFRSRRSRTARL